jgi:hypothetical protein
VYLAFSTVNILSMALLYGRAGRSTAHNGGFRPGQTQSSSLRGWRGGVSWRASASNRAALAQGGHGGPLGPLACRFPCDSAPLFVAFACDRMDVTYLWSPWLSERHHRRRAGIESVWRAVRVGARHGCLPHLLSKAPAVRGGAANSGPTTWGAGAGGLPGPLGLSIP